MWSKSPLRVRKFSQFAEKAKVSPKYETQCTPETEGPLTVVVAGMRCRSQAVRVLHCQSASKNHLNRVNMFGDFCQIDNFSFKKLSYMIRLAKKKD